MNKIFKCFISSTFKDLEEERRRVIEAILDARQLPTGMENFNASDRSQWDYIKMMLEDTDYFIVIIAHKYGTTDEGGMSYTEKEVRYALDKEIPVLTFIIDEAAPWDRLKCEDDAAKRIRLSQFKEFLKTDKLVKYWTDKNDLAAKVTSALHEVINTRPRPGYIRGTVPAEPVTSHESARKPEFTIEFGGKPEIKVSHLSIHPVEQLEIMDHVQELSHGQPVKLNVSDREVDKWNRAVPGYNREIDEYNAQARAYNKHMLAIPCGFSVCNTGTKKATDLVVAMEFPDWIELFDSKDIIQKPEKPRIPVNPVRRAMERVMERMKGVLNPVQVVHGNMVTPIPETPMSLRELAVLQEQFEQLSITSSHTAEFRISSLLHKLCQKCDFLHILPAAMETRSGTVKVSCICEELPEPQVIEIPISMEG